jgi:hypothetical protein
MCADGMMFVAGKEKSQKAQRIISCSTSICQHATFSTLQEFEDATHQLEQDGDGKHQEIKYLVKWRGLPYCECTWERWQDIKQYLNEILAYWRRQRSPHLPKPFLAEVPFKPLTVSPIFAASSENDHPSHLTLHNYQLRGVNWLLSNWFEKRSCILADDIGLGKTIQSLGFLSQLPHGPFLIIVSLSLLDQWQKEISTWLPHMNCIAFIGNSKSREIIQQYEFYSHNDFDNTKICKFDILLTTYEIATKESQLLRGISWKVMIVDEAHRLKMTSRLYERLQFFSFDQCVLLTSSPLLNQIEDLFPLLHLIDQQQFPSQQEFISNFGDLCESNEVRFTSLDTRLVTLKPYILRRVKEDIDLELMPSSPSNKQEEIVLEAPLTVIQRRCYRQLFESNAQLLVSYEESQMKKSSYGSTDGKSISTSSPSSPRPSASPSLMSLLMDLRKCCNHPSLLKGIEVSTSQQQQLKRHVKLCDEQGGQTKEAKAEAEVKEQHEDEDEVYSKLLASSGKLLILNKLLTNLATEGGHKVVIFSQMVSVLDLLEEFMSYQTYRYSLERIDGSTNSKDRQLAVDRFRCVSSSGTATSLSTGISLLLMTTRSGGAKGGAVGGGIEADMVIFYDSDWNPYNDQEALGRISYSNCLSCPRDQDQDPVLKVYRLVTLGTIEMYLYYQALWRLRRDEEEKERSESEREGERGFENVTVNGTGDRKRNGLATQTSSNHQQEISEILKRSAFDFFRKDNDSVAAPLGVAPSDGNGELLLTSFSLITERERWINELRRSSFPSLEERGGGGGGKEVDINDPQFWRRVIGFGRSRDEATNEAMDETSDEMKTMPVAEMGVASVNRIDLKEDLQEERQEEQREEKGKKERPCTRLSSTQPSIHPYPSVPPPPPCDSDSRASRMVPLVVITIAAIVTVSCGIFFSSLFRFRKR